MPFSSPEMWDFAKKNTKSGNVIKSQKVCVQFLYQHVSWIGEKVTFSEFCTQKIHGQTVQFNLRSCSFSILAPDFAVELLGNCLIYRHFPLIYQILSKSNVYYFCQALGGRINFFPISGLKHICWMVFGYKVKGLWPFPPIFSMEFVKKNDETFPECPKCKILLTITKSGNFVNILSKNLLLNNSASAPERKILENNVFTLVHVIHKTPSTQIFSTCILMICLFVTFLVDFWPNRQISFILKGPPLQS